MKKKASRIKDRSKRQKPYTSIKTRATREKPYLLKGVLKRHSEGFGFVIPEDRGHPDIYIPSTQVGSALSEDQVEVLVYKKRNSQERNSRKVVGLIKSILKRDREFITGFVEFNRDQAFIARHNLDFSQALPLQCPKDKTFKEGDYVKARILYKSRLKDLDLYSGFPFQIELSDNLGSLSHSASDDRKRIMAEYDLPFDFSKEVLDQARSLPNEVKERDYQDRKDLRSKSFITIDGASAQDFDDAILVEKKADIYKLYVAIADVSYYVEEGSSLDQSAFERGNSSYFPDFCIPMLPEKLSNELCSLKENEDRLVMVQEMSFNLKGELVQSQLYPSVIRSQKRLTYTQVQNLLDSFKKTRPSSSHQAEIQEGSSYIDSLKLAQSLTQVLIQKHKRNEGFDLDIPETLIILDSKGEAKDLVRETRLFSHKMIEHFMLACNQAVSVFLTQRQAPFIYRVHESPKKTQLAVLEMFAKSLSFSKAVQSRKEILSFLNQHKNHERKHLIHKLFLRSMSQARYSSFNKGHYGLNFKLYTHFTSPIRRYSDLIVHRLVKEVLHQDHLKLSEKNNSKNLKKTKSFKNKKASLSQKSKIIQDELEKKASWLSTREQKSVKAERRIKNIKSARFLKTFVGETRSGFISSITSFGAFITLEDFFVEGLVRFRELKGFWEADEMGLKAENKRTNYQIKFGDPVKVLVQAVCVETGQIDLKIQTHKEKKLSY